MPNFARGHNSLTVLKSTGVGADGKKIYERVPNPNLSPAEKHFLLAKQKNRTKKELTPAQKEAAKVKAKERYDALLKAAGKTRKRV